MKRFLPMLALLLFPALAQAQSVNVQGNLLDAGLQNITGSTTFVRFKLTNYGSNQPRVVGTGVVVELTTDCSQAKIGALQCKITENDQIEPQNTVWNACFFDKGHRVRCMDFLVTATPFNFNTANPITQFPTETLKVAVVTNPSGTQNIAQPIGTELQVNGAKVLSEGLIDEGTVTIGFGRTPPLTGSTGTLGLPNNICVNWRNAANSAEICGIEVNGSDEAEIGLPAKRTILGSAPVYRGANHLNGSYALSAGWGNTATVAVSSALEKDGAFEVGVTASGTGIAANPVVTLSFLGGSLPVGTFWRCIIQNNGGSGPIQHVKWFTTNTFVSWTWLGTPVAGQTHFFTSLCAAARD